MSRRTATTPEAPPAKKGPNGPVTHLDVAREAGVSRGLVSAYFTGNHVGGGAKKGIGISQATRLKIKEAAIRLKYAPETPQAFFQLFPEQAEVAFLLNEKIVDGFTNPYYSLIFEAFAQRAREKRVDVTSLFFNSDYDYLVNPELLPGLIQRGSVRKVVIIGGVNYSLIHHLLQADVRVIVVGQALPIDGLVSVMPDFQEAGRMAIQTLAKNGHRSIAAVAGAYASLTNFNSRRIWDGCLEATRSLGLLLDERRFAQEGSIRDANPASATDALLAMDPRPSGVFCFDDNTARRVINGLNVRGVSVPGDLSVVGCNDDRINREMPAGVSTIHFPCEELGHCIFEEITRLAVEGRPKGRKVVVLQCSYVDRGTVKKLG